MKPAHVVRWALVLPAAWAAWAIALATSIFLHGLVEAVCPRDEVVSGHCAAPWVGPATEAIFGVGAAVAATLIVLGCTLAAPSHRRQVAALVFACGTVVALWMGTAAHAYMPLVCALVAGALTTTAVRRRA
jgi:hypothetical protein